MSEVKHTRAPLGLQQFGDEVMVVGKHSDRPIVLQAARKGMHGGTLRVREGGIMRPITMADEQHPDIARWFACVGAMEGISDPAAFIVRAKALEETVNRVIVAASSERHDIHHAPVALFQIEQSLRAALALPGGAL